MAHFYLNFETMKHFTKITGTENIQGIFGILITCPDFSTGYHLRVNEKRFLNELNKISPENDCIRFPIQGKVKTVTDKVSCLMQAILGNIPVTDSSITEEASQLVKLGQRIGRALQEFIAILDVKNNFFALVSITLLLKSLHANLWENSPYVFKQFNKIGHVYSKVLASNGKTSFESILSATSDTQRCLQIVNDIEMILKKQPPFGKDLLDGVLILPQFTLSANVNLVEKQIYIVVKQINPKFVCDSSSRGITLIIGDSTNETLFIDYRVQYFLVKFGIFERKVSLKNPSAASVTAHLVHNRIVGLDKSETITLRPNEQSSDPMEKELPVLQVSAPKRKSSEKGGRQAKQPKIPEYFTSPKKAPKRKNNSTTEAKKARSSHAECDRQMELLENDGIGVVDLTTENAASKDGDTGDNQAIEKNGANANQNVIEFIQSFKMPTKSVFKFIRPTKPLTDYPNVVDSEEIVEEPVGESENISNSVNAIPQTSPVLSPTNNARDKSFTKMTIKAPRQETHSNESNNSTNLRKDTAAKETGGEAKAATEENRDAYVPSCIKAMFGSQMVSQKVQNQMEKNVPSRKKDIQFRYDHLLTAAEEKEEEATTFAVNSQNYSLCDVIDGQHKLYRTPASRQSPAFPFRNLYIENFCAAKELEKIDQLSHSKNDVNDSEGSLFSLDYNTLPSQRSSLSSYQPKQQQQQPQRSLPEHQPLRMKEQQNKIALFQSKPMDKATPMTLNEHKYSKRNQFQKKLQTPQPCTPVRSPNEFQWTDKFQSSQKRPHKPVLTQPFYNNLLQRVVPAMSAEIVDHYSEPNVGFTSRNDGLF